MLMVEEEHQNPGFMHTIPAQTELICSAFFRSRIRARIEEWYYYPLRNRKL